MPTLQRLLSDLLNLFFRDPDYPDQLWGWWKITWVLALMVGMCVMVGIS